MIKFKTIGDNSTPNTINYYLSSAKESDDGGFYIFETKEPHYLKENDTLNFGSLLNLPVILRERIKIGVGYDTNNIKYFIKWRYLNESNEWSKLEYINTIYITNSNIEEGLTYYVESLPNDNSSYITYNGIDYVNGQSFIGTNTSTFTSNNGGKVFIYDSDEYITTSFNNVNSGDILSNITYYVEGVVNDNTSYIEYGTYVDENDIVQPKKYYNGDTFIGIDGVTTFISNNNGKVKDIFKINYFVKNNILYIKPGDNCYSDQKICDLSKLLTSNEIYYTNNSIIKTQEIFDNYFSVVKFDNVVQIPIVSQDWDIMLSNYIFETNYFPILNSEVDKLTITIKSEERVTPETKYGVSLTANEMFGYEQGNNTDSEIYTTLDGGEYVDPFEVKKYEVLEYDIIQDCNSNTYKIDLKNIKGDEILTGEVSSNITYYVEGLPNDNSSYITYNGIDYVNGQSFIGVQKAINSGGIEKDVTYVVDVSPYNDEVDINGDSTSYITYNGIKYYYGDTFIGKDGISTFTTTTPSSFIVTVIQEISTYTSNNEAKVYSIILAEEVDSIYKTIDISTIDIWKNGGCFMYNLPLLTEIDLKLNQTDLVNNNFYQVEKEKAINPIIDMERIRYEPVVLLSNGSYKSINSFIFKFHFNNNIRKWGNLGFDNLDVKYQKSRLKKTFMRLSYYDEKSPTLQSLLYFNSIFVNIRKMFSQYMNPQMVRDNKLIESRISQDVIANVNTDEQYFSIDFEVKNPLMISEDERRNGIVSTSSEGYYLYLLKDGAMDLVPKDLYIKVEFNNALNGKRYLFFNREPSTGGVLMNNIYFDNSGIEDFCYLKFKTVYDDVNDRYVYYPNTDTTLSYNNGVYTINIYEAKIK